MTATSLVQLTGGEYFRLSPLASRIADLASECDKTVELSLVIEVVKELDFLLQCPSSGRIVDGVRWIWETYKDWRDKRFPYHKEYRVRKVLDVLKSTGILLMEQFDLHKPRFSRKAYWRLDYEKLETLATPRRVESEEGQSHAVIEVEEEALTHLNVCPVHTHTTSTLSTFPIQLNTDNNVVASEDFFEEKVNQEELVALEVKVEEVKECINRNWFNYNGALMALKQLTFKKGTKNPTAFLLKALRKGWGKNSAAAVTEKTQNIKLEPTPEILEKLINYFGAHKLVKDFVLEENLGYPFVWGVGVDVNNYVSIPWWQAVSHVVV